MQASALRLPPPQHGRPAVIAIGYHTCSGALDGTAQIAAAAASLRRMSDEEAVAAIRAKVCRRFRHARLAYNAMLRESQEKKPHQRVSAARVSLRGFQRCLAEWDLTLEEAQVARIVEAYEGGPGLGLDYTAFAGILSQSQPADIVGRRDDNAATLGTQKAKAISMSMASHVLERTNASVPSGKFADYDNTIPVCQKEKRKKRNTDQKKNKKEKNKRKVDPRFRPPPPSPLTVFLFFFWCSYMDPGTGWISMRTVPTTASSLGSKTLLSPFLQQK